MIVALGRLGWSLRRIERTTGVRRETISGYLKAVGIVVPGRGRRRAPRAVEAAYYGTPPGWIGRRVDVQWNDLFVRLLDPKTGQLLREHVRAPRGWHRIADADRPRRTPPKTVALLDAAVRIGPSVSTICDHIHRHEGEAGVRRILGVLSLAKKYGPPSSKTPRRPRSISACPPIASSGATSNAGRRCH